MSMENIDKTIEILKAFKEGKTLEHQDFETKEWHVWNCDEWELLNGFNITKVRIKPEPKLRPYQSAQEFLKASKEHGPYIGKSEWMKQFYKIPSMIAYNSIFLINNMSDNKVEYKEVKYSELLNWRWEDGTSCGIYE